MNPHVEIESTRSVAEALGRHFWAWEVPVYLFLGGLVAGIMIAVAVVALTRGHERVTEGMRRGLLAAPVLLTLGIGALFLDLEQKHHVYRFYTSLRPSAPMSWGSWILLLVYPVLALTALALPATPVSWLRRRVPLVDRVGRWAERHASKLHWGSLAGGVALGMYTGVLLSTTVAHSLWSSGALGALFLASGVSTGIAALMLVERDHESTLLLARADVGLVAVELALVALWLVGLLTQGPAYREAAGLVLWGPYAPVFVGFVLFGGLIVPAVLETLAVRGRAMHSRAVPALVLVGGFLLRVVVVYAGQDVTFFSV